MSEVQKVFLFPGQLHAAQEETLISTVLGSCVAVALYDPVAKVGGLNHYLLPEVRQSEQASGRYGDFAIPKLIHEMEKLGALRSRLKAKIYGGANVMIENTFGESIGSSNIIQAYQMLQDLNIPILEEFVGGNLGRRILLNTQTFTVEHRLNVKPAS